jgi:hypothetical protein
MDGTTQDMHSPPNPDTQSYAHPQPGLSSSDERGVSLNPASFPLETQEGQNMDKPEKQEKCHEGSERSLVGRSKA